MKHRNNGFLGLALICGAVAGVYAVSLAELAQSLGKETASDLLPELAELALDAEAPEPILQPEAEINAAGKEPTSSIWSGVIFCGFAQNPPFTLSVEIDADGNMTRVTNAAETPQTPAEQEPYIPDPVEEEARLYDRNGQKGEPPAGWKPDYSHWDTADWRIDIRCIGTDQPNGVSYQHYPIRMVEEGYENLMEYVQQVQKTKGRKVANKIVSLVPRSGDIPSGDRILEDRPYEDAQLPSGKIAYIARTLYDIYGYRSLGNHFREFTSPSGFGIVYYRDKETGILVREPRLPPEGEAPVPKAPDPKRSEFSSADAYMIPWNRPKFVAAPAPDLSGHSEKDAQRIRNSWGLSDMYHVCFD